MAKSKGHYESIAKTLAPERLRALRRKDNLRQVDFAERINLSVKGYANYERGERELPQSARLAILSEFKIDLLPSEALQEALESEAVSARTTSQKGNERDPSFWSNLRAECRADREKNYSRPARIMLAARDHLHLAATAYFTLKYLAIRADIPFGIEVNGVDWAFIVSLLLILMFFVSIMSEVPAAKIIRHLRGRA
jgi:transcriptional regulator with XRE-family HTH domain